ncbi:MAG: hypothetical protein LBE36_04125 [Flavobacteriaceae bacterium]|jgi:hypothetical protein|nr:hypothetical protein [Flavobacteriaceae bacterium]
MKKSLLICTLGSFIFGFAQEKKIAFTKELNYEMLSNNKRNYPDTFSETTMKMYAGNNGEFFSMMNLNYFPMSFYTDALGTSAVTLEMGNRLASSDNIGLLYRYYYGEDETNIEPENLGTKETILGISCNNYLLELKRGDNFKICVDEKSTYNNVPVLGGIIKQFYGKTNIGSSLKGLILRAAPENSYDNEYIVLTSIKDSKDFVFFNHSKAMTDRQRKLDSLALAYQEIELEIDSTEVAPAIDYDDDSYVGLPPIGQL